MTTSNTIVIATLDSVLSVPLEAIHAEEGHAFVYKVDGGGLLEQEVKLGPMNDNNVVVEQGLGDEDLVYLSKPPVLQGLRRDTLASTTSAP
jgi:multidrug efflux pump subunit AcrA (membrane-fusion protein)